MNHLNDHNALYRDGSSGGLSDLTRNLASYHRKMQGRMIGLKDAKNIFNLIQDNDGNIKETIKIITHSMGAAYAKGYIQALLDYAKENGIDDFLIEFESDFAPFQPRLQKAIHSEKMGPTLQFSHDKDMIAGKKPILGAQQQNTKDDKDQGHSITSFINQIMKLPEGNYKMVNGKIVRTK